MICGVALPPKASVRAGQDCQKLSARLAEALGVARAESARGELLVPSKVDGVESVPGLPASPGVYYQSADGFVTLQEASTPGYKTKGFFKNFIPGAAYVTGGSGMHVYRDAHAPIQIEELRPIFYLRGAAKSGRDALIVRLDTKKDGREVQISAAKGIRGGEAGYKDDKLAELTVEAVSAYVLRVTPAADLEEGEYLLIADEEHAYDFGIAKSK